MTSSINIYNSAVKYVKELVDRPLSLLEETVTSIFDHFKKSSGSELMDRNVLEMVNLEVGMQKPTRLVHAIQRFYFQGTRPDFRGALSSDSLEYPTNDQAYGLYQVSVDAIRENSHLRNPLSNFAGKPEYFGEQSFELLQEYLIAIRWVKERDAIKLKQFKQEDGKPSS